MAYNNRLIVDPRRVLAFGAIGAAYAAIGAAVATPVRIFILTNLTDVDVDVSVDGVNDHFILPTNTFKLIDITANKVRDDGFFLREGTIFYIKQTVGAPTLGSVYVEIIRA